MAKQLTGLSLCRKETAYSTRLLGCSELPIAVVHSHDTARMLAVDDLHGHVNLGYVQSWAQSISARPLNEGYFGFCTTVYAAQSSQACQLGNRDVDCSQFIGAWQCFRSLSAMIEN